MVAFEVLSPTIAFLLCVLCFARIKIINSNFYKSVEWPIIVMLAAMIPIGLAILATEFIWAKKLLKKFKEKVDSFSKSAKNVKKKLF